MAKSNTQNEDSIGLSEMIEPELIEFNLKAVDRWDALEQLLDLLVARNRLPGNDRSHVQTALFSNEERKPSDIKNGVAVPSAPVDRILNADGREVPGSVLAVGRFPAGFSYGARDGVDVVLVFLMLLPRNRYAKVAPGLRHLARLFDTGELVAQLMQATSVEQFVEMIEDAEAWEHAMDSSHSMLRPPTPLPQLPPSIKPQMPGFAEPPYVPLPDQSETE